MADLQVACVCGWETLGSEDEVIVATQTHGREVHNMETTREQVLEMATPAAKSDS